MDRFNFRTWEIDGEYWYFNIKDADFPEELANMESFAYEPVSSGVVEQCTGLKDKNGKLIYEGDIVMHVNTRKVYTMKLHPEYQHILLKDTTSSMFTSLTSAGAILYETIGNIHENPELLKGED